MIYGAILYQNYTENAANGVWMSDCDCRLRHIPWLTQIPDNIPSSFSKLVRGFPTFVRTAFDPEFQLRHLTLNQRNWTTTNPATSQLKNFQNFGQWDVVLVPAGLRIRVWSLGLFPKSQWNLRLFMQSYQWLTSQITSQKCLMMKFS